MKLAHKLILGMLMPALVIGLVGMYVLHIGQASMRAVINDTSAAYVSAIMAEIDRSMHSRIVGWKAYSSGQDIQDYLVDANRAMEDLGNPQKIIDSRDAEWRALDDDFAFVAECNEGGEFMAPERVDRLKRIAARTWQRTLDDRIGISWEEKVRKDRSAAQPLPASEPLLADRPEHLVFRAENERMPPDNPWGFKLDVPEHKYNRGELHNLSIARGTLSPEERYAINDHIVQTIIMLSKLPFPKPLRRVPEYAGGHHEKLDGTGYPKRLTVAEMSLPARMMAIADIFEALTASDRPYKKPKRLSEAIKIMGFMRKDRHIDPELFELFLTSGVYLAYAERFLAPEQIDPVDVSAYVAAG